MPTLIDQSVQQSGNGNLIWPYMRSDSDVALPVPTVHAYGLHAKVTVQWQQLAGF